MTENLNIIINIFKKVLTKVFENETNSSEIKQKITEITPEKTTEMNINDIFKFLFDLHKIDDIKDLIIYGLKYDIPTEILFFKTIEYYLTQNHNTETIINKLFEETIIINFDIDYIIEIIKKATEKKWINSRADQVINNIADNYNLTINNSNEKILNFSNIKNKDIYILDECSICTECYPSIIFIPCNHVAICISCFDRNIKEGREIDTCYICRKKVINCLPF